MQRLDYYLTLQSDERVHAELHIEDKIIPSGDAPLNLSQLVVISEDYLPLIEATAKQIQDRLQRLGTLLYELVFPLSIRGHFEELAWRKIAEQPDEYHLTLSLTMQQGLRPDVAALPWEFLYCPR